MVLSINSQQSYRSSLCTVQMQPHTDNALSFKTIHLLLF